MPLHHRGHFVAFALLPALNTLGLLIHGLNQVTHGTGNTGRALVIVLVSAAISLASVTVSTFKRARHLGYESSTVALGLLASLFLGPVLLLGLIYLAFAPARAGTPPKTVERAQTLGIGWLWAPILLIAPWMALLVASATP